MLIKTFLLSTLFSLVSAVSLAQAAIPTTLTVNCSPATVKPPATLTCSLVQSGGNTSSIGPVVYIGTITATGFTPTSASVQPSASAITAGLFVQQNGLTFALDWLNSATTPPALTTGSGVPDGTLATVSLMVPSGTGCPGNSPCLIVGATVTAASATAAIIPVTVIPSTPVAVNNWCDVNGDGQITVTDAVSEQTMVMSKQLPGCDRDGDGACTAVDFQIVANAVLGKLCSATK